MLRRLLLKKLADLDRPNPGTVFALLWDFFRKIGLDGAENQLREMGEEKHLLHLYDDPRPCLEHSQSSLESLRRLVDHDDQFDLQALRWIKRLDRDLKADFKAANGHIEHPGLDGSTLQVKARNNFIADHLGDGPNIKGPPGTKQGNSLALFPYCLNFMVIGTPEHGKRIECRTSNRGHRGWTTLELELLLGQERADKRFSVLLWPFSSPLRYEGVNLAAPLPNSEKFHPVRFARLAEKEEILREALEAIAEARRRQATLLLFPELSLPPAIATALQQELRSSHDSHRPLLTLFGACHCSQPDRDNDLNEAVLLGPDGRELLRHRKLSNFIAAKTDGEIGERIDVGKTISVLESPIGNLVPLICLDLFHDTVAETLRLCHGNTFLVPSLSPKTSAHRSAAREYCRQRWVSTFVCNQWLTKETDQHRNDQSSFIQVGNQSASQIDHQTSKPSLNFQKNPGYRVVRTQRFLFFELC